MKSFQKTNFNYKNTLSIQVRRKDQRIELLIFKNNQKLVLNSYTSKQIASSNPQTKVSKPHPQTPFNCIAHPLFFGTIYLFADSSILLCIPAQKSTDLTFYTISIKTQSKVRLDNLTCQNLLVKAGGLSFKRNNQIKEALYYRMIVGQVQKQVYNKEKVDMPFGMIKIKQSSRLQVKCGKIVHAHLQVHRNSSLKVNTNSFHLDQKAYIKIDFQGKLYGIQDLTIQCGDIINQGYISSKNQNDGVLAIDCKLFQNYGQIKMPNLKICSQKFSNKKNGSIQGKNGQIIVQSKFVNEGHINCPKVVLGKFQAQSLLQHASNSGTLITKLVLSKCIYLQNLGIIATQSIKIHGNKKQSIFKNNLALSTNQLQLIDIIFVNHSDGFICSDQMMQVQIDGWINNGQIQNKNSAYVKVKGDLHNQGTLIFNKELYIKGTNLYNKAFITADNANLTLKQVFFNSKQATTNIKNVKIQAKKVLNLGKMQIKQTAYISTQSLQNLGSLNIHQSAQISTQSFSTSSQSTTYINRANLSTKNLHNEGNLIFTSPNITTNNFANHGKAYLYTGELNSKTHLKDNQKASTNFTQMKYNVTKDNTFDTKGHVNFDRTQVKGIHHFYNKKNVDFQDTHLQVQGLRINNITMKNAKIGFGTFDQQNDGKIYHNGGVNGLYQGNIKKQQKKIFKQHQKKQQKKQEQPNNIFEVQIVSKKIFEKIQIVCSNPQSPAQIKIHTSNRNLNGWQLLFHPIGLGTFTKQLSCPTFNVPFNLYDHNLKQKQWRKIRGVNPNLFQKYNAVEIPNTGEKALTIQMEHLMFGGKMQYNSDNLKIKNGFTDLMIGCIQVPNGVLEIDSAEAIVATHAYLNAKGIKIKTKVLQTEAVKFVASAQDMLIQAICITDRPTIIRRSRTTYSGDQTSTRTWQQGHRSKFYAQGHMIIMAQDYITMISPQIQAKKNLVIGSQNTRICGMFLFDQTVTTVQKETTFGGSKTNTYVSRNDKPLPAFLKGDNITFLGKADINATITANKLIDLTKDGLRLGYVIGYSGEMENREFSNFCTQGVEGFQITRQKFLRANLINVAEIIRPAQLGGQIIFDTVQWGKVKPIINAKFKQLITKPKTWSKSWEHQGIGMGLIMVISICAGWAGGHLLGPAIIGAAGVKSAFMIMAIKTASATICSRFAVSLAVTGNLGMALKSVFSLQTVISAAANIGLNFCVDKLAGPLGIKLGDSPAAKQFPNVLKKHILTFGVKTGIDALRGQKIGNLLTTGIKTILADTIGQYFGYQIGLKWGHSQGVDYLIHKGLHGALGAIKGLIMGGTVKAMLSGAIGAIVAQVVIQALVTKQDLVKADIQAQNSKNSREEYLNEAFQVEKLIAKVIGACVGGVVGMDIDNAMRGANDAIDYNFEASLQAYLSKLQYLTVNGRVVAVNELQDKSQKQHNEDGRLVAFTKLSYPLQSHDDNTPVLVIIAQKQALLDSWNKKFAHLNLQGYKVQGIPADKDLKNQVFCARNSKQKVLYIGVSGTRFTEASSGPLAYKDGPQDVKIQFTGTPMAQRYARTKTYIQNMIMANPGYKINIVGHSLGGNLTQNIAYDLIKQFPHIKAASFNSFTNMNPTGKVLTSMNVGWQLFSGVDTKQVLGQYQQMRDRQQAIKDNANIKRFQMKDQWSPVHCKHGLDYFDGLMVAKNQYKQHFDKQYQKQQERNQQYKHKIKYDPRLGQDRFNLHRPGMRF